MSNHLEKVTSRLHIILLDELEVHRMQYLPLSLSISLFVLLLFEANCPF